MIFRLAGNMYEVCAENGNVLKRIADDEIFGEIIYINAALDSPSNYDEIIKHEEPIFDDFSEIE